MLDSVFRASRYTAQHVSAEEGATQIVAKPVFVTRTVQVFKCATDQAQRRGVKRSAGPYTGLFYAHLRATQLGMRVEPVLNIDGLNFALHSPWPHTRDDPGM